MNRLCDEEMREDIPVRPSLEMEEQPIPEAPTEAKKPINWAAVRHVAKEVIETVVLTALIFFVIQALVRNFRVVGSSMEPNLFDGQYLIIDKVSYRLGSPQRGDVIVFQPPNRPDQDYVKRIIGLPGEVVEVKHGQVFINGQPLVETYVVRPGTYDMAQVRIGPNEYFVLGDNRNNSSDSHSWGTVPAANIIGRAWLSYWPPERWGVIPRDAPTASSTLFSWLNSLIH